MSLTQKIKKCKDKRECFTTIGNYLEEIMSEELTKYSRLTSGPLYLAILLATSQFINNHEEDSYKRLVEYAIEKYKSCVNERVEEIVGKLRGMVEEISKSCEYIEKLSGESGFDEDLARAARRMTEKDEYVS
ncbi:MAG: hypothetical protein QW279_00240 [Candidatus Jordarchaeaceae archaeon]